MKKYIVLSTIDAKANGPGYAAVCGIENNKQDAVTTGRLGA